MSRKSHGSPLIADYLTNWTSPFFLEGESGSQFFDFIDVNVFTGIMVDICHDASWYQKKHWKNSFSSSIQWCNLHLATMLRSRDIQVSYVAFQKNHTVARCRVACLWLKMFRFSFSRKRYVCTYFHCKVNKLGGLNLGIWDMIVPKQFSCSTT